MGNLPKEMKTVLSDAFDWSLPELVTREDAPDGASKLLLKVDGGKVIETVICVTKGVRAFCLKSGGLQAACSFADR